MTSVVVHCLLEAISTGTTSGTGASPCERLDLVKEVKVGCDPYCRAKVHHGAMCEGEFGCWNLHGPLAHIPNTNTHLSIYGIGDAAAFVIKGDTPAFVMRDRIGDTPSFMIKGDMPLETHISYTCIIGDTQ
jgi:hypothetical protein